MNIFYLIVVIGIFASACSQILLKKSANRSHSNKIYEILNWRVIIAYGIFFCSMLINIFALRNGVYLKDIPILEALGYIFVPILSSFFLFEKITKRVLLSMVIILVGIFIFYQ